MRQLIHALAGGGDPESALLALALIALAALYLRGSRRLLSTATVAFLAAAALLWAALASPFDALAAQLFSAHMAQHLTLVLIVAPLFVLGRAIETIGLGLPVRWRRGLLRLFARAGLMKFAGSGLFALLVWLAFCGVFLFWHLPRPYLWGFQNEFAHYLEHASLLLTACAFWTVALERSLRPRIGHGAALMHVATAAVIGGLPGALMILAARPFYKIHAAGAAHWGMTLVEDQQLAGLIMWVPAGFVYLGVTSLLLLRWLGRDEAMTEKNRHRIVAALALFVVVTAYHGALAQQRKGDQKRGVAVIEEKGCGACHEIPGVNGAHGVVGPPLTGVGDRVYLAGELRNTPDNMAAWIMTPQQFRPGSPMPDMGLTPDQASDVTAYLESLH